MIALLNIVGWLACVVYSTIPLFWMMIHPFAEKWRRRRSSPYPVLLPLWMAMWIVAALITARWRELAFYQSFSAWIPAGLLFVLGLFIYSRAGSGFNAKQLAGLPELHGNEQEQRLVTDGIHARVRHPIYLAHLCEMLAWSLGTGLAACWALTTFAIVTGAVMIRMEDRELERRYGMDYRAYRASVPALIPRL
jgi:protein-S-isoprenylcysteine O-methyltransferase Ste14